MADLVFYEVVTPGSKHKFQTIDKRAAYREKTMRRKKGLHATVKERVSNDELSKPQYELSK